ncbi:MAG: MBL fold metallo-hydrolase [Clostridia bacterium]|nr:MBL fold metallo-hydrolase [Clostridia bacterium]
MKNELHMLANVGFWQTMSFIVTTRNGRICVIDGGRREDAQHLLDYLRAVSGSQKPHVDAWFLTHAHDDHIDAFVEIMENRSDECSVGAVYYCFPSIQYFETYEKGSAPTLRDFYALMPRIGGIAHTVSTGDVYRLGDATFEVLQTCDDTVTEDVVNNSSTVLRLTQHGKTLLFLGDAGEAAGARLLARYGEGLKSDICQMAHHGQDGVARDVYEAIRPETALWCAPAWLWDNDLKGTGFDTSIFLTVRVREWMAEIGTKAHLVAKDGDQVLAL